MRVLLLTLAVLLGSRAAVAQQRFYWEGIQYEITSEEDRTVMIYYASRCVNDFKVPKTVPYRGKDYAVTKVGCDAFQVTKCIVNLDLSDVETIEDGYIERTDNNRIVIYHGAFEGCKDLVSVKFRKVKHVGDYAFHGCTGLKSIRLDQVETVGRAAFYGCTNVGDLDLCNVKTISDGIEAPDRGNKEMLYLGAFAACPNLVKVDTKNVETVGDYTFHGDTRLKTVTIGEPLRSIGVGAFAQSLEIDQVKVNTKTPPVCEKDAFDAQVYSAALLQVPAGTTEKYRSAAGWQGFLNIDEGEFSGIESAPFDGYTAQIKISGNRITVEGLAQQKPVAVFDVSGRQLQLLQYEGQPLTFQLPTGQIYLLRIGQKTYKLAL